jgi:predicted oxidoreductase
MRVEDLLEKIEEILDNGQKVAFSSKVTVDVEAIRNCADEIRANMPEEVRQARNIVRDRNKLIDEATQQAETTLSKATERAQETINKANAKAKEHILSSVDGSLKRLGIEHIDVLLLHRPDLLMEPSEVAEAFDELETSGKVGAFGVSNHSPLQIELLQREMKQKLSINQMQLSITNANMIASGANVNLPCDDGVNYDGYLRDYCRLKGITIQPWSPLQYGFIEGSFVDNRKYKSLVKVLEELAEKYGTTPTGMAIAWILRLPDKMQPIVGSTNPERIKTVAKVADISISREDWYRIYREAGYRLP